MTAQTEAASTGNRRGLNEMTGARLSLASLPPTADNDHGLREALDEPSSRLALVVTVGAVGAVQRRRVVLSLAAAERAAERAWAAHQRCTVELVQLAVIHP